ncbi:hypothetical protein G7074_18080 [Pedobacter sp. HDW13]|uniref:hypothetical protein n=1 Tax=Pedobacter sp. HDW13 TaxID=2714940 RepID=UPI00140B681D|nr:hypothetical protein [Pedobacter sp. HDW13]QIL37808.1 hypothetical protein G7074_18080 [Pedobacter sp. HDW13]
MSYLKRREVMEVLDLVVNKMQKLRIQPLTEARMRAVGESYRMQYILCRLLDIEYSDQLDVNFRKPAIHNHIRRAQESIKAVHEHSKLCLEVGKDDNILESMCELHEIVKMIAHLDQNQIKEVCEGMRSMFVKEA